MNSFDCVQCAAMRPEKSILFVFFGAVYTAESFGSILLSAFMSERRILCASAGQTSEQLERRGIDFGLSRIGEVWFERKTMERSQALGRDGSPQHIPTPNTPTKIVNDICIYINHWVFGMPPPQTAHGSFPETRSTFFAGCHNFGRSMAMRFRTSNAWKLATCGPHCFLVQILKQDTKRTMDLHRCFPWNAIHRHNTPFLATWL